jgi:hypothetical protein
MLNKIIYKVIYILVGVTILAKLYSYIVVARSEKFKLNDIYFEKFKAMRKKDNICSKPFRPTCNRDKIYSTLRFLEDKIDELEYKLYRKHREKQRTEMDAEGKKRAQNIKRMIAKDNAVAERDMKRREQKARALENNRTVINARNEKERAKLLKDIQNDPGVKKPPKLPSFSSQSRSSPIMGQATAGINKGKGKINSELSGKKNKSKRNKVMGKIDDAQSKIDTPSEFVL